MSWKDELHTAMAGFLRERGVDAVEVTGFNEDTAYGGYCETCSYEYVELTIYYTDSTEAKRHYELGMSFADLMTVLTD